MRQALTRIAGTQLAPNPAKAAVERWWLRYTLVWGAASAAVMLSGWAESWKDVSCMIFGVLVAAGALAVLARPHPSEQGRPWAQRTSVKLTVSVVMLALGLNYTQTPFFFDVLHMHYGFNVQWTIDNNPLFLYFVTIAYFATYAPICMIALRWAKRRRLSFLGWLAAPLLVALLETVLNANPFMKRLFCYDDLPFMLWFGTLTYAVSFALALPVWMAIDEDGPNAQFSLSKVAVAMLLVIGLDYGVLELTRHYVAPSFTTVIQDAPGLRDQGSCLGTK